MRVLRVCGLMVCTILCLTILSSCSNEETKAFNDIKNNYEQKNMQIVMDDVNSFKQEYPDSTYTEEIDKLAEAAEKYIANNFTPVEEKYYKNYIGVLDFGAYTGLQVSECGEGSYTYQGVKDYMLINYVDSLKEIGFEDDGEPSYLLGLVGIETNDVIYLKNVKYQILLMYQPDSSILAIVIS